MTSLVQRLHTRHIFYLLSAFLLLWRIPYYGRYVLDDPFITFRYGFHLARHGQFTYNLGDYVLATTTPVYGFISTLIEALNLPIRTVTTVLNLACEVALLYVLGLLVQALLPRGRLLAYGAAGLLIITNRAMSIASNSGMETPLFVLLNLLALLWMMRGRYTYAAIAGSAATLTRPEGVFVLAVLAVFVVMQERRLPLRETILSLLIGLPWLVVATLTYGLPIPQSVLAKSAIMELWEPAALSNKLMVVFYEPLRFFGLLALLPLLWGLRRLWAERPASLPLLMFLGLHLIYLTLPNNLGFDWYFAPLFVTLSLMIGIGLVTLLESAPLLMLAGRVCAVGLLAGVAYSSVGNYLSVAEIDTIWREGMLEVVDYLNENAAEDAVIQSTNIGILGYYTHRPLIDPLGLATPEATAMIDSAASLDDLLRQVAARLQPDYIVSFGPEEYAGYAEEAEFPTSAVPLILYRRTAPADSSTPET